jgi:hypothetical protein
MRQGVFISLGIILLIGILAVLNAVTYVQKEKLPDRESSPNRSTYNTGATGTQAFYTLLAETGHNVSRWPESTTALLTAKKKPAVFVIVGLTKRELTKPEIDALLSWVASGGRLVIVDRDPQQALVRTSSDWQIEVKSVDAIELYSADPSDQIAMTSGSPAVRPLQPSIFTHGITALQPSRFAGTVKFSRRSADAGDNDEDGYPRSSSAAVAPSDHSPSMDFGSGDYGLVVDTPYGSGRIVFLADPYVISNSGIALADNARLGVNLVNVADGSIVFDEYHQGYGSDNNRLFAFFAGTPIVAVFMQAVLLVGLVFYSQSRRFGRPIPEAEPDRLSKLEYIAAMAELQQRTRAYDLALENIYGDFRRRVSRALGLNEPNPKPETMAKAVAERTGDDAAGLRSILLRCEDIIRGDEATKKETLDLAVKLREIESRLGLNRAERKKI